MNPHNITQPMTSTWRITGVDRETGETKMVNVSAIDEKAAMAYANELDILVEKCRRAAWNEGGDTVRNDAMSREYVRLTISEQTTVQTLRGLAALLCVVGVLMMIFGHSKIQDNTGYYAKNVFNNPSLQTHRFHTDNAVGATANATEYIADHLGKTGAAYSPMPVVGAVLFLAGIVSLIPAELIRQRAAVRHYGGQLLAQRGEDHPT